MMDGYPIHPNSPAGNRNYRKEFFSTGCQIFQKGADRFFVTTSGIPSSALSFQADPALFFHPRHAPTIVSNQAGTPKDGNVLLMAFTFSRLTNSRGFD